MNIKTLIAAMATVLLSVWQSCDRFSENVPQYGGDTNLSIVCLTTRVSGCVPAAKSLLSMQEEHINDLNVWAYSDGILAGKNFCTESAASILLEKNKEYNLYLLANTGRLEPPATELELLRMRYKIGSYSSALERGIPMASDGAVKVKPVDGEVPVMVTMKRLVAKYTMTASRTAATGNTSLIIQSVNIRNAPSSISPFALRSREEGQCIDGDCATSIDIQALNADGTASFYILENMQGQASGIKSPQDKCAENIAASSIDPSRCTYVEIRANIRHTDRNGAGSSYILDKDLMYSFYLGANSTDDLNIERNVNYIGCFKYSDFGWSLENHRCSVLKTYDDTTYSLYFCTRDGTPAEELTLAAKDNPAYVYFKVLPQIDGNLSLSCSDDYESLHLERYAQVEKVSDGLYRQAFINHSDQRLMNQSTVFTISDAKRELDASVLCNLESSGKGVGEWEQESDQDIYF